MGGDELVSSHESLRRVGSSAGEAFILLNYYALVEVVVPTTCLPILRIGKAVEAFGQISRIRVRIMNHAGAIRRGVTQGRKGVGSEIV